MFGGKTFFNVSKYRHTIINRTKYATTKIHENVRSKMIKT